MLADDSGMGQSDGRTERGGHRRAIGWSEGYVRTTWVHAVLILEEAQFTKQS